MKRIGAWLCGAAFCLAALPGTAQSPKAGKPAKAEQFTESTEVLVVEVPVQVLRGADLVLGFTSDRQQLERQVGHPGEPDRIAAGFRPPTLPPGDYHLLVTLTDPAGGVQTSTAEFTVPPGGGG